MEENDYVGDYVNQMKLVAKELSNAGHPVSNKMQVTTILNSLPLSWDHVVTSLTHSGKEISMTSLPVLLVLEKKMYRRGSYKFTASTNKNTKVECIQIPWKQEEIQ
jgi:hypothetical protein